MQSIVTPLQSIITSAHRRPRISMLASWLKQANLSTVYAEVDASVVGGPDLVQGQSVVITNADLFDYIDESSYVMGFDYERWVNEPRGGTSNAIGDFTLDNITRRFSPNRNATIGTALEARRPIKASIGFLDDEAVRSVQVIVGLTADRPKENRGNRIVEVPVYDYITFINNSDLAAQIYEDKRSDEIIESILTDLGFGSSQYELDTGLNTIPFAWFPTDKSAGQRIKEICEAEEAHFYQDENAVLRFETRNHYQNAPHTNVVHRIHPGDIVEDEPDDSVKIINRAIVSAKPRKIDAGASVVWESSEIPLEISAGNSVTIWPKFLDDQGGQNALPVKTITTPASSTDYVANSQSDGMGTDKTAQLGVTVTNFVETAKLVLTNNDASTIYVTTLQLRGQAARVTQAIQAISEDSDSINKYEAQEHTVTNDLIQDPDFAQTMADNLVNKYKSPLSRRRITIPGIPHLQLKDRIKVRNPDALNLIPNPSFEGGTTNWSLVKTGSAVASLERTPTDVPPPHGAYTGHVEVTQV